MVKTFSVGSVLTLAAQMAAGAPAVTSTVWLILTVPYLLVDLTAPPEAISLAYGVLGLVSLYLQLLLTSAALSCGLPDYKFDSRSPTRGRFPAMFALAILWCLGVLAGLVLLVIPGLILFMRWSVSVPALLAEDLRVIESLRRSWKMTRPHWKPASLVLLLSIAFWIPGFYLIAQYPEFSPPTVGLALATNALFASEFVFAMLVVSALYVLIRQAENREDQGDSCPA